jgi:hypothetical protein
MLPLKGGMERTIIEPAIKAILTEMRTGSPLASWFNVGRVLETNEIGASNEAR